VVCVLGMGDEFRCRIPSSTLPYKQKSREMVRNRGRRGEDDDRWQDAQQRQAGKRTRCTIQTGVSAAEGEQEWDREAGEYSLCHSALNPGKSRLDPDRDAQLPHRECDQLMPRRLDADGWRREGYASSSKSCLSPTAAPRHCLAGPTSWGIAFILHSHPSTGCCWKRLYTTAPIQQCLQPTEKCPSPQITPSDPPATSRPPGLTYPCSP
jgi:hypothetical protein